MRDYLVMMALAAGMMLATPVKASEENFNQGAYDSASETGIDSANCNAALLLTCEGGATYGAPAPAFGGFAAAGLLVLFGMSRLRKGSR